MSKHKTHFGIKDAYLYHKNTSDINIEYSIFTSICKEFYKEISNMIVFNTFEYANTNKLWSTNKEAKKNKKLVFHLNDHSNGYQHRWFWEKRESNIPNHSAYCFLPSRLNKRTLAKALKDENTDIDFFE